MANTVLGTASNILTAIKNWANGKFALASKVGAANGIASLGADGKVPSSQLPSYVDDVLEYTSLSNFPTTGETGKIYVDTTTNHTYRWSGSTYVEISSSLALGETSSTAYAGNKGKANADAISSHTGNATIHVTADNKTTWNAKYNKPSTGIPKTDLASDVQTSLGKADSALQSHQDISGKEDKSNKVTSWSSTTTDAHYPSEKLVKTALDGKGTYSKPSGGIPKSDLASAVQTSLGKADTALQSHQSLAGYVPTTRKVAGKALSSDVTINVADIADLQFMTPEEMVTLLNS